MSPLKPAPRACVIARVRAGRHVGDDQQRLGLVREQALERGAQIVRVAREAERGDVDARERRAFARIVSPRPRP